MRDFCVRRGFVALEGVIMRQGVNEHAVTDGADDVASPAMQIKTLLVGEDDKQIELLRGHRTGVDIVYARSMAEALAALAEDEFEAILYDLDAASNNVQGLADIEALGALETPLIALVSDDDSEKALEVMSAGAQDCLVKSELSGPILERALLFGIERKKRESHWKQTAAQFDAVFAASNDGLVINSLDGKVVDVNPTFCRMHGYTREEMIRMQPAEFIHPNSHHLMQQFFEVVRAGGRFQGQAMDIRKDGTTFNVGVHGTAFMFKGEPHVLGLVRDITEQVKAYELLEQRVEERTRELSMLLDVSNNMVSTLELETLLNRILEQLKFVADYDDAALVIQEPTRTLILNAKRTPLPSVPFSPLDSLGVVWEKLASGEAVLINDAHDDSEMSRAFQDSTGEEMRPHFGYIRSWLGIPIRQREKVVGFVGLIHAEPGFFNERHIRLATALVNQAAIAIENAELYEQAYAKARETAALAQTAAQVAFGGSLDSTLDSLCKQVVGAVEAFACAVLLHDYNTGLDRVAGSYGLPEGYVPALNAILASGTRLILQDALAGRQHMVRRNMRDVLLQRPEYAMLHPFLRTVPWDSVVAMPMVYRDTVVGVLISYHHASREIGEKEITFHGVMADQAAVAVENARLLAQTHDKARLEERQRLARELHDSVTQALFSISLIARSAEVLMEREGGHSEEVMEKLADLRQLTQGALAEMRALIFELRPGALDEEGLYEALRKHAAALQSREMMRVEVTKNVGLLPRLKPEAEEGLYRIAQEALHNIVKHAKAQRVDVNIVVAGKMMVLRIADDGLGFNLEDVPAGHMGLGTMRQRAEQLGGEYEVESYLGRGTIVKVRIPLERWQA